MTPKYYVFRLLFVGLLFYPTLAQHVHIFEHHEHHTCEDSSIHFHEGETSCELLDYVSNAQAVLPIFSFFSLPESFQLDKIRYVSAAYSKILLGNYLRGPPLL
jgi:hypothetical protein